MLVLVTLPEPEPLLATVPLPVPLDIVAAVGYARCAMVDEEHSPAVAEAL